MSIKKHIPNTITLGNLFCGCLALISTFNDDLIWAAYFVGMSLVLDFFDGFTARMLKVSSAIGKDLDSLADMVTFGVVPGMVMFQLLENSRGEFDFDPYPKYFGLIITIFSCIRLAKFNNDTRQSDSFIGLPTPANTMVICSLPLILHFQSELTLVVGLIGNLWFLCSLSVVMSLLLIAEIPLFALKFKSFGWKENKLVYSFLIVSVILMIILKFLAVPLIILLYILLSIVNNLFLKKKL